MPKKKLKNDVIHNGTIYKTLEEVPTDLLRLFDEKGFIVEDVAEAGPADIEAEMGKRDALLRKAEDELIETLAKLEAALKRATNAERKLVEALDEMEALRAHKEEAEATIRDMEGKLADALKAQDKGGKKGKPEA